MGVLDPGHAEPPATNPAPAPTPNRPRVLLVEDNDAASRGLARLLEARGFEVSAVPDGRSAIQALQSTPHFDFLLTDLRLPDVDGREVARIAHEQADPPRIALVSGWDLDPDPRLYATWGIEWIFAKPLDVRALVETLRRAMLPSLEPGDPGPGLPGTP